MNLAEQAYNEFYPDKPLNYEISLNYSAKFKSFNANIKMQGNRIRFNLSRAWKGISKEIQIGLMQSLLVKLLKEEKKTINTELYEIFMKKVHIAIPKTKKEPALEESFNSVNNNYFDGLIEIPNLVWGNISKTKLGSYEYGSDTITISSILKDVPREFLDYVMYHEVLHKKHKFYSKNGRNYHHTALFREKERQFPNSKEIEKSIQNLLTKKFKYKALSLKNWLLRA